MYPRNKIVRLFKFLGKTFLALVLCLILVLLLIHIPAVQDQLSRKLAGILSSKTEARIHIDHLRFSIWGDLTMKGIEVRDRKDAEILSVEELHLKTNLFNLLSGHYVFNEIVIKGADGFLSQEEDSLNIQFILDAFTTDRQAVPSSGTTILDFRKISLERCAFHFASSDNGEVKLDVIVGRCTTEEALLALNPNKLNVGKIRLQQVSVMMLSDAAPGVPTNLNSTTGIFSFPMIDPGMDIGIRDLEVDQSAFAYHHHQVIIPPTFDPSHLSLKEIRFHMDNILISNDTLALDFNSLSMAMPGFNVSQAGGQIRMNGQRMDIPALSIKAGSSELFAQFESQIDSLQDTPQSDPAIKGTVSLNVVPSDVRYFFGEENLGYIDHWDQVLITLTGEYRQGKGRLESLAIQTEDGSRLYAAGRVHQVWDPQKLSWEDLLIEMTAGQDFKETILQFNDELNLPGQLNLKMISSGDLSAIKVDGGLTSSWGNVSAKGMVRPSASAVFLDMHINGDDLRADKWMDLPWISDIHMAMDVQGTIGKHQDLNFRGLVGAVEVMDQHISDISLDGKLFQDSFYVSANVADPNYQTELSAGISFADSLVISGNAVMKDFRINKLMAMDSLLTVSGNVTLDFSTGPLAMTGWLRSNSLTIKNNYGTHQTDTLSLEALISPTASHIGYFADDDHGWLSADFDLMELPRWMEAKVNTYLHHPGDTYLLSQNRSLQFDFTLNHSIPLSLLGLNVDEFSGVTLTGTLDEEQDLFSLEAVSGRFKSQDLSLESMHLDLDAKGNKITGDFRLDDFGYGSYTIGDLEIDLSTSGDTLISDVLLSGDSMVLLDVKALVMSKDTAVVVYPKEVKVLSKDYAIDPGARVLIRQGDLEMDHFRLSHDDMYVNLHGGLNAFEAEFNQLDLTALNDILFPDSSVIDHGILTGKATYTKGKVLHVTAVVDSLVVADSFPVDISLNASSEGDEVPFEIVLSSTDNNVEVRGKYFLSTGEAASELRLDIQKIESFSFLYADVLEEMKGRLTGEAKIYGPVMHPEIDGQLQFHNVDMTTSSPRVELHVEDDVIRFDGGKMSVEDFNLYDRQHHPLTITGYVMTKEFSSFTYDLKMKTDHFTLLDVPEKSPDQIKGLLVVAADIDISGDQNDTYVKADIAIRDATSLVYTYAEEDVDLLKTEGIIEFVDPNIRPDTSLTTPPVTMYDSLVSKLPDFILESKLEIGDSARIRVVTNAQSGDYFEAVGGAKFDLEYNRTGNVLLSGNYTVHRGVYRVSFYDLVKKNFSIVPQSSVRWSGSPETGEIDVTAVHSVTSNSIGLVGHEVGENEKSIYKKALEYIIGINIKGTMEKPVVSFTLDLPKQERANYPVLANKLDRLRLPEFQTELNKQVFGLLVLGGFLPESTGAEVNSNQVATTALYNSVNSLLASQLNRFAGQHLKGVNIDVGIQSYADYSTPGGKTQTSMDFRVSKSILNERLSFEVGGDFDISTDQSGANTGDNYRGDVAIIYDLTGNGDKQLKLFNNETYDIIYQEIRNTGISLVFIREFDKGDKIRKRDK